MLLTFPPPAKSELDFKYPHEFVPHPSPSTKRLLFKADRDVLPPLQAGACERMSQTHRGLPPPAAMTLPDPGRIPPPMAAHFSGMPAPPPQWQGAEDSMRSWLTTKAEEEKRRQEEERTRQESFRLEQRKIEQSMLSESIRNGVPPTLVPLIFAGIGGSSLSSISIEWIQQYAASLQAAQQQQFAPQTQPQSQGSPDIRRDRMIGQSFTSAAPAPQPPPTMSILQGHPSPGQTQSTGGQYGYQPAAMSPTGIPRQPPGSSSGPTSAPRAPLQNVLPRLTTNEMHTPSATAQSGPTHSAQQEQTASSPSIYFHHWVPPTSQGASSSNTPGTPSEYVSSPKKRKAQGAHQAPPVPSSAPPYPYSPSFVHVANSSPASRPRAHARRRSDASARRGSSETHGRATRSSAGYAEGSPAETEEQKQRQRQQYPVGGGGENSDSGSHGSYAASKTTRNPADSGSIPGTPKQEGGPVTTTSSGRVNFGPERGG